VLKWVDTLDIAIELAEKYPEKMLNGLIS